MSAAAQIIRKVEGGWTRAATNVLVVLLVLAAAAYLGREPSTRYVYLACAAAGGLILFRWPELGLVAVLVSALCVPFALATGTKTSIHAAILLIPFLFALLVANGIRERNLKLAASPANVPLIVFCSSAVVSFLVGNMPWNYFAATASLQAQLGGLAVFLLSAALFLVVGNLIREVIWLKRLVWLFLAIGAAYMVGRLFPPVGGLTSRLMVSGATGSLFWLWIVALAGGQVLFNRTLAPKWRLLLASLICMTLAIGWFQNRSWLSGWMPPLVVVVTLVWLYSWRFGLILTLVAAGGVLLGDPGLISSIVSTDLYTINTRLAAWQIMLQYIIPINPLLGLGPANYYFYTPLFPILGYYVRFNSHNQYIDILAQTGIVGLLAFAWLMFSVARMGWNLRGRVEDGFARGYVYGCLAGLAGSLYAGMQGDWFLPFVYNIGLAGFRASLLGWLFLGGLVAIEQMVRNKTRVEPR